MSLFFRLPSAFSGVAPLRENCLMFCYLDGVSSRLSLRALPPFVSLTIGCDARSRHRFRRNLLDKSRQWRRDRTLPIDCA